MSGIRTLIMTRPRVITPKGTVSSTDASLLAQGWQVAHLPLFDLSADDTVQAHVARWVGDLSGSTVVASIAVFVSPGALTVCRGMLPDPWPAGLLCGVMGEGSAVVARSLGIPSDGLIYPTADGP